MTVNVDDGDENVGKVTGSSTVERKNWKKSLSREQEKTLLVRLG